MGRKIGDVVKTEPAFPNAENVKGETLVDKELTIKGCATRTGGDGDFLVVLADVEGKEISFSNGGKVIMDKIAQLCKADGVEPDKETGVVMLKEPTTAKLIQTKSKEGRFYYDLE